MSSMDFDLLYGAHEYSQDTFNPQHRQERGSQPEATFVPSTPVNTMTLHTWLCTNVVDADFLAADTVVVFTDTRPLSEYKYFAESTADLWFQRLRWKNREKMHVVFVPILDNNGLTSCHLTHAAVHVMRSLRSRFPGKHFISADADVGPTALSEVWQWISLARACHRLCQPRVDDDCSPLQAHMPGLLLCNDKGARANAGLVISPGIGQSNQDRAHSPEEWCRLLDERMEFLLRKRSPEVFSDVANNRYGSHLSALACGTKLGGVLVEQPQDYFHLWAVICNVLSVAAWPMGARPSDHARLGAFSDVFREACPRVNGWAGPFCEQPALAYLEAFQTPQCYMCNMASELGFMNQFASQYMGTLANVLQSALMPCLFLHAYGVRAKKEIVSFRLRFWVNMSQSLQGALHWRPCFMDGSPGSVIRVAASCGFQVEMLILDFQRRMVDESGWQHTPASCNRLFLHELSQRTINDETWPLWSDIVRDQIGSASDFVDFSDSGPRDNEEMNIYIACPGLQNTLRESGRGGYSLFLDTAHIAFTNAGPNRYYGPTRESSREGVDGDRHADFSLNALHYLLRDRGCRPAWEIVLPQWEVIISPHDVPFCPSWLATPCSSSVFAVLATALQFTHYRDSYLCFFGLVDDGVRLQCLQRTNFYIRGILETSFVSFCSC